DVAEIDADAEFDALVRRHAGVALAHAALDFHRATHSVDDARELDQHAVAGGLDDLAAVLLDLRVDQGAAVPLQSGKRALLVRAHQPAVTGHIGRHDRRQLALGASLVHGWTLPGRFRSHPSTALLRRAAGEPTNLASPIQFRPAKTISGAGLLGPLSIDKDGS